MKADARPMCRLGVGGGAGGSGGRAELRRVGSTKPSKTNLDMPPFSLSLDIPPFSLSLDIPLFLPMVIPFFSFFIFYWIYHFYFFGYPISTEYTSYVFISLDMPLFLILRLLYLNAYCPEDQVIRSEHILFK